MVKNKNQSWRPPLSDSLRQALLTAIFVSLIVQGLGEAQQTGPEPGGTSGGVLRAEISHSDTLPPLPPGMRAGEAYMNWAVQGGDSPYGLTNRTLRFEIPAWLAGRWQRTQSMETKRVELPSGKPVKAAGRTEAKVQEQFGTFVDGEGKIWQVFDPRRSKGEVDRGEAMDIHHVSKYNIEILDPKNVLVSVTATHLVVSKDKRMVLKSYQDEELNTYTLTGQGRARTDSSVKVFDQSGKPVLLTRSSSDVVKLEGVPANTGAGARGSR